MEQTCSDKKQTGSPYLAFFRDRTVITLLLTVVLMVVMGMMRPDRPQGMSTNAYWATKANWEQRADAVLTGDSRVLMALSPEILKEYLDYESILNYAFGANWYCTEYMQATENLLYPDASPKAIIMGFSPHSLTWRVPGEMGHFIELRSRPEEDRFFDMHFGPLLDFFEPMSLRDAMHGLFPSMAPSRTFQDYKENGWIAVHKSPGDEDHEVKRYRGIFKQRQVDDRTIAIVTEYVSRWSQAGIKVYGFMPPTCPDMVELEMTASGFKKDRFVKQFEEAGGTWLEVNLTAYYSFDGSHLQDEGAIEFSHDLGRMIQEFEGSSGRVARTK